MNDEREGLPSASGADRVYLCPASPSLERMVPRTETESELATEGSLIHEALYDDDHSDLSMSQAEIAEKITLVRDESYRRWREEFPIGGKGVDVREERMWIYDDQGNKQGSAKPDRVVVIEDHALIQQYKSGFNQSFDASRSIQGRVELLAVKATYPEVVHVRVMFIQARLSSFYSECDYSAQEMEFAKKEWDYSIWRSNQPDAPAIPGHHCRWCRAKSICRAAAAYSMLPATTVPLMLKTDKAVISNAVASLTHSDLVSIHERAPVIKNVLEAVSARLKALPVEELKALGLELKAGSKYTSKVEVNPLFQLLWDEGVWNHIGDGPTRMEFAISEFSTVTTVLTGKLGEILVRRWVESGRFKTKKAAEEHLKDLLAQVSTQETKEPTLRKIKE